MHRLLIIFFLASSLDILAVEAVTPFCRAGWELGKVDGWQDVCIFIGEEHVTWTEAETVCRENLGELVNVTLQIQDVNGTHILQRMRNGRIMEFWTGMHYDGLTDRLVWDDFPATPTLESNTRGSTWRWGALQPASTGMCGSLNVTNYFLRENPATAALENCQVRLPFVCTTRAPKDSVGFGSMCPSGWIGNKHVPKCYRMSRGPLTFTEASSECVSAGGALAAYDEFANGAMVNAVYTWYQTNDAFFTATKANPSVWIRGQKLADCSAVQNARTSTTECNITLPYLCEIDAKQTESFEITVSQGTPPPFEGFIAERPLTCTVSRLLTELESLSFFRNGERISNPVISKRPDLWAVPYVESIIIPSGFDYYGEGEGLESFNYEQDVGYFWCEVASSNPVQRWTSEKTLVRYQESDLIVYYGYANLSQPADPPTEYIKYNLLKYLFYNDVRDVLNNLRRLVNDRRESIMNKMAVHYLTQLSIRRFSSDGTAVEFILYITEPQFEIVIPTFEQDLLVELNAQIQSLLRFVPSDITNTEFPKRKKRAVETNPYGIIPDSFELRSTAACPDIRITDEKTTNEYVVKRVEVQTIGSTDEICITDLRPMVAIPCKGGFDGGAFWDLTSITYNRNCSFFNLTTSDVTLSLGNISEIVVNDNNLGDVTKQTANLTSKPNVLTSIDVIYTATILTNIAETFDNISAETVEDVLDIVDNILEVPQDVLNTSQTSGSATNRIVEALDNISRMIDLGTEDFERFVRPNVFMEVWNKINPDNPVIGIRLSSESDDEDLSSDDIDTLWSNKKTVGYSTVDTAIILPESAFAGRNDTKLVMYIYRDSSLFDSNPGARYKTNGKVVSATLSYGGVPLFDLGSENVTTVYRPFQKHAPTCGFYDYMAKDTAGGWSTQGCSYVETVDGRHICTCNHLTNFAVLLDFHGQGTPTGHEDVLNIITIIGLSLSIAGLTMTVLSFVWFRNLRKGRAQQTMFNLALSMLCSWIVFLAGINQTQNYAGCIVVAVLLHYFILVTFMWMLMEGILQYLRFVKVLGTYIPRFMIKTAIPAWVLPLLPVIIVLAIDYNLYHGGDTYCWMSLTALYYAFAIPVGLIILANIIIFIIVIVNLLRRPKGLQTNQSEAKVAMMHFWAALSVFVILGLTWIFGFFAISEARVAFQYIFTILNVFQGFFIFILFTAREKTVRKQWKQMCCKGQKKKSGSSSENYTPGNSQSNGTSGKTGSTTDSERGQRI